MPGRSRVKILRLSVVPSSRLQFSDEGGAEDRSAVRRELERTPSRSCYHIYIYTIFPKVCLISIGIYIHTYTVYTYIYIQVCICLDLYIYICICIYTYLYTWQPQYWGPQEVSGVSFRPATSSRGRRRSLAGPGNPSWGTGPICFGVILEGVLCVCVCV